MKLKLSYRGALSSCNYSCGYCPFAKTADDAETKRRDKDQVERFVRWVENRPETDEISIMFTPWGEALVRSWYQNALIKLSHLPQVKKVVIQTNLSGRLSWLEEVNTHSLSLWITYHSCQIELDSFIQQTQKLDQLNINYSVGIVGTKDNLSNAKLLKQKLNPNRYLWVNAYKDQADYYQPEDIQSFIDIDPYFSLNLTTYDSYQEPCNATVDSLFIDGEGNVQACHFVKQNIGNIYKHSLEDILNPSYLCPNQTCGCYIGYIHLPKAQMTTYFDDKLFERIPVFERKI